MSNEEIKKENPIERLICLLIELAILGLAVAGVVLASIDFAHGIFNSKSICFMIFGIIGLLLCIPTEFVIKTKSDKKNQKEIEDLKNKILSLEVELHNMKNKSASNKKQQPISTTDFDDLLSKF